MPPGGGRGEGGRTEQGQPPVSGRRTRGRDAPSHSSPPIPSTEISSENKKQKPAQQPLAVSLPEGPFVEILSRVPYRSLCRFKSVSKSWLALCSDPAIRKRSRQVCDEFVSGFFFLHGMGRHQHFRNLSGRGSPLVDPSLPFLRKSYEHIRIKQCCGGILFCICWKSLPEGNGYDCVVCNPATEKWSAFPPAQLPGQPHYRLGFDASCFVVFAYVSSFYREITEMAIYSSETGRWSSMQSKWGSETSVDDSSKCVFLNGMVHLCSSDSLMLTVDWKGQTSRKTEMPHVMSSIGQSQGQLYAWHIDNPGDCKLYIWVLKEYASGKWTRKLTVNVLKLFGRRCRKPGEHYELLTVRLGRNLIYLTDMKGIVSYDMVSRSTRVLRTCEEHFLGPAVPYVRCLAEWSADDH